MEIRDTAKAVISAGGNLSAAVDLTGRQVMNIQMSPAWTTADITFQASADGITYADLWGAVMGSFAQNEVRLHASAGRLLSFQWKGRRYMRGIRYLKVRSGTSATPVAQAAERTITLILNPTA